MLTLIARTNDKFGRKRSIQVCAVSPFTRRIVHPPQIGALIALWGCAMQAGANNFACMLVGRIVAGFAIGYVVSMLFVV